MKIDKGRELEYIYETLRSNVDMYMLSQAIELQPYCSDDVHRWGREDEYYRAYGKVRDILELRILSAINGGKLEKTTGEAMLKAYYYRTYSEKEGTSDSLGEVDEEYMMAALEFMLRRKKIKV
jgi:hypothetical protein